jgi:hypothetical protein
MDSSGGVQVLTSSPVVAAGPEDTAELSSNELAPLFAMSETALMTCQDASDCDAVLDTLDSCVGCVEGVGMQHQFEEAMVERSLQRQQIAAAHGLSEEEATMIRRQIMNVTVQVGSQLPDLDLLNLCGRDEVDLDADRTCAGVVTPTDTTTYFDGDRVMELHDRKSQSLVDAAEDSSRDALTDANMQCSICFDEAVGTSLEGNSSPKRATFAYFPCCGSDGRDEASIIKICTACILVLTMATSDALSRVGRCPRCRSWITATTLHSPHAHAGLALRRLESAGKCGCCMQAKEHLVEQDPPTCDACFLGKRTPLLYECEECHKTQKIPHPMYRYQKSLKGFGNVNWACQGECQKFTYWRICDHQLEMIPVGDVSEEWGDDCLESARARVQKARRGIARLDVVGGDSTSAGKEEEGCIIL